MKKIVLGLLMVFVLGCTKDGKTNDTVSDLPSVTIGTQIWTIKNLDVATYSDGTPITQVTDPTLWKNLTTGAWCYYNNDAALGSIYGKLYNWYAVVGIWNEASKTDETQRKKLAPKGYHIPSDGEWGTLTGFLGEGFAGDMMKETGIVHWNSPNQYATNSSGFTGLPGGGCYESGTFGNIGITGNWWSSSSYNLKAGWPRTLYYNISYANSYGANKSIGMSVRCLKD